MIELRNYQEDGVVGLFDYFKSHTGNPIAAYPTGTGKSIIIAEFIRRACAMFPNTRILKLTHDRKLIRQNFEKLLELWPTAPAGVYSAGLNRREIRQITYGGIGTLVNRSQMLGHIDLIIIDECHRVSPKEKTSYLKLLGKLKAINPLVKVIGLTATPYRLGQGLLTEDGIFTDIAVDWTSMENFNRLLADGYLCRLVPKKTKVELDVEGVRTQGGEFVLAELQKAVDKNEVTFAALKEALEQAHDRNHWLVFCSGVEHAEHVAAMLNSLGVSAGAVHSKMPQEQQEDIEARFVRGEIRALVNNDMFTTGFDFPGIDCIVVLRPTQSPGLWVQMLGRGTRPRWPSRDGSDWHLWPTCYPDRFDLSKQSDRLACISHGPKPTCLVLDFAANTRRLGPINDPRIPRKKGKGGTGAAPVRICDECGSYCHASLRTCPDCGYVFPVKVKFGSVAAGEALIIGDAPQVEVFQVQFVSYRKHHPRSGNPPSLCITYTSGLRMFTEWVCLEHPGFAGKKAREWWRTRDRALEEYGVPETIDDALSRCADLLAPTHLRVWINKKHPEILASDFSGTAFKTTTPSVIHRPIVVNGDTGAKLDASEDDDVPF